jgi:hypothetical protein
MSSKKSQQTTVTEYKTQTNQEKKKDESEPVKKGNPTPIRTDGTEGHFLIAPPPPLATS